MNTKTFGQGNDIIFLHGWGGNISSFLFLAKRLSNKYRVTLLDMAGFGESREPSRPYSVNNYAEDVIDLMDKLSISKAVVVGHSFGGRVGIELATKWKDRINALVLIDSAGIKPKRRLKYYVRVALHKFLKHIHCKGLKGSKDFAKLSDNMKKTFINVVNYDQTPLLKTIEQPTAIFWGKQDRETPVYMAKKLKKLIPDSQIFWLNGGHFAYLDDYYVFLQILMAFLKATDFKALQGIEFNKEVALTN